MEDGERIEKIYRKGTRLKETLDPRFHHFIEEPMRRLEEARLKVSMRLFRPYYEEESALLWIGRHLELHPVDRKLLYHLNIISNIIHNGTGRSEIFPLYRRLPQEALGGLSKGGRRNAQASLLLRGGFAAGGKKPEGLGTSGYTAEQELLGSWAERDGCWKDFADGFLQKNGARFLSSGSEARVYLKNGYVYKTIDWNHYGTMAKVLDRISIHNAFFPETKMEVLGFGMRDDAEDNRGFCVIVKQPFVVGEIPSGPEEVHTAMKESGIDLPSFASAWCFLDKKENILLYDLHDQNIVVDKYGNVQVFDCEAFINTDPKLHGTFEIPDVKGSEAAVRRIDTILDSLLPVPMSRRWFLDTFSSPESGLAEQLDACGHIDGTVRTPTGQEYLVEADPEDPGNVLISTPTQVAAMLRGCPDIPGGKYIAVLSDLVHGKTVDTPSGPVRFSLDRGRLEKCPSQRTLKKTCRSERKINPVIESTKGMHL